MKKLLLLYLVMHLATGCYARRVKRALGATPMSDEERQALLVEMEDVAVAQREDRGTADLQTERDIRAVAQRGLDAPGLPSARASYLKSLGASWAREGNAEKSCPLWESALAANPIDAESNAVVGVCRMAQGDHAGGIEALTDAVRMDALNVEYHQLLVDAYDRAGDNEGVQRATQGLIAAQSHYIQMAAIAERRSSYLTWSSILNALLIAGAAAGGAAAGFATAPSSTSGGGSENLNYYGRYNYGALYGR